MLRIINTRIKNCSLGQETKMRTRGFTSKDPNVPFDSPFNHSGSTTEEYFLNHLKVKIFNSCITCCCLFLLLAGTTLISTHFLIFWSNNQPDGRDLLLIGNPLQSCSMCLNSTLNGRFGSFTVTSLTFDDEGV